MHSLKIASKLCQAHVGPSIQRKGRRVLRKGRKELHLSVLCVRTSRPLRLNWPVVTRISRLIILTYCCCLASVCEVQAQQKQPATERKPGASQSTQSVEYLARSRAGAAPFSEAVRVGPILYLSGQLGVDGSGALVSGGIKAETKQVLENIRSILEKNNSGTDRVVKCTVMLAEISDRSAMSEVYVAFFLKDRLPARSTFGTSGLALGAKVEIECMATIK